MNIETAKFHEYYGEASLLARHLSDRVQELEARVAELEVQIAGKVENLAGISQPAVPQDTSLPPAQQQG